MKCLSDYFLITNKAVVYPALLSVEGEPSYTLLNMPDSDLSFPGQSRLDSLCLVPVLEKELTMTGLPGF